MFLMSKFEGKKTQQYIIKKTKTKLKTCTYICDFPLLFRLSLPLNNGLFVCVGLQVSAYLQVSKFVPVVRMMIISFSASKCQFNLINIEPKNRSIGLSKVTNPMKLGPNGSKANLTKHCSKHSF